MYVYEGEPFEIVLKAVKYINEHYSNRFDSDSAICYARIKVAQEEVDKACLEGNLELTKEKARAWIHAVRQQAIEEMSKAATS